MEKLDKVFSEYIRLRDADENGYIRCYCCGNPVHWTSAHAMHYINRWHLGTRFDERNVHAGCVVCNCYNSGNIEAYEKHLIHEYGESIIDKLRMKKSILYDKTDIDTKDMMKHYRNETKRLRKEKGL